MRLAEDITITVQDEEIELRPTLRHAFRLFRKHKPADLSRGIQEGSLSIAMEIVAPFAGHDQFVKLAVFDQLNALKFPLLMFVAGCMGVDVSDKPQAVTAKTRNPVDPEVQLTDLYKIATGWLGYTPDQALDCTPKEIIVAHQGRVEMLGALFGNGKKAPANRNDMSLDDKFKMVLGGFETVKVTAP